MRDIKLRAWDIFNETMVYSSEEDSIFVLENGKWSVKYIREKNMVTAEGFEIDAPVWHESDEIELMQYTGLKDKNGKEIYEGDIIEYSLYTSEETEESGISTVVFDKSAFYVDDWFLITVDEIKVIGNIYENTELIAQ